MFTVCALLYGDYPALAERLLSSLPQQNCSVIEEFRIGLNAVSTATETLVQRWAARQAEHWPVTVFKTEQNPGKYPMMRQMLQPKTATHLMWFDDDSFLDSGASWWQLVADKVCAAGPDFVQLGIPHAIRQRGEQYAAIRQQPWYQYPVSKSHHYRFITGGWWVADAAFLRRWDYPFKGLHHNGGDSILGELIRQQNRTLHSFPEGARCHCEAHIQKELYDYRFPVVHINVGGRKGRRGLGRQNEVYIWEDGDITRQYGNFQLEITKFISKRVRDTLVICNGGAVSDV
jgi:hypothetical protein